MSKQTDNEDRPVARPASSVPVPKMRRGPKSFYNDVVREMRHVTWPKPRETNRLTGVVFAVCLLTVIILTVLSIGFDTLFRVLFRGGV
jgi:preprotein translocase SecE subunit